MSIKKSLKQIVLLRKIVIQIRVSISLFRHYYLDHSIIYITFYIINFLQLREITTSKKMVY